MSDDRFLPLELVALGFVTGGRISHGPAQVDPALIQGIGQLAQAVQGVGQTLAATKQQGQEQSMQFLQQMMQGRGGA